MKKSYVLLTQDGEPVARFDTAEKRTQWLAAANEGLDEPVSYTPDEELVVLFNGGYGREGVAGVGTGHCTVCDAKDVPVMYADASEGEYRTFTVCLPCVTQMFKEAE